MKQNTSKLKSIAECLPNKLLKTGEENTIVTVHMCLSINNAQLALRKSINTTVNFPGYQQLLKSSNNMQIKLLSIASLAFFVAAAFAAPSNVDFGALAPSTGDADGVEGGVAARSVAVADVDYDVPEGTPAVGPVTPPASGSEGDDAAGSEGGGSDIGADASEGA
ncbi:hypothetical protein [Parasitella parasitica]|uniref:Uncharacterized protein n=1 Tax=Parasitella parasitica TaxID=35722 RepID=A0A0B7NF60_9FUNG|nr:hypothetical protein [Parasitella parasitica]